MSVYEPQDYEKVIERIKTKISQLNIEMGKCLTEEEIMSFESRHNGVRFGWAGNRAVVYVDPKVLTARKDYDAFLEKLFALPIPDLLKATKESISVVESESPVEDAPEHSDSEAIEADEKNHKKADIFKGVKKAISTGTDVIGKARTQVTSKSEEVFRNKSLMKRQMLFYGVVSFYNDGLEKFMNM